MLNKIFSLLLMILIIPIYIIIALVVIINDGFPIFYFQEKYGKNNKIFKLYKFRTMKKNAPQVPTEEFKNANKFIIRGGTILRMFSLDELPQFFNVLKGDMNIIGPRPSMTLNEEKIKEMRVKKGVHKIKPGITGWAQVNGRDLNSFEKKVELDYYYLLNKSLWLDLKIIFMTFKVVLITRLVKH